MRNDFQNLNKHNWETFEEFDELKYAPLWRKILIAVCIVALPFICSIENIAF